MNPSRDLEDALYKILKRDHEFNDPRWPFVIKVRDVQGKTLIDATFLHRTEGKDNEFDAVIQAKRGVLRVDTGCEDCPRSSSNRLRFSSSSAADDLILIDHDVVEIPIPPDAELACRRGRASPACRRHGRRSESS